MTCPSCGAEAPAGARFCPACGAALADATAPADMLKLVTILFADTVGSTARAEALHPEDMRALMADFFAAMSEEIRALDGTVEKYVGDAIMAVFGVPTAHEDDAVRAVRAARRMLERLRSWNGERGEEQRLEIRVGVNTGDVVASGVPGGDLLVTGDAVNVAARLEQTAEPGTIVVGERTARAVRPYFDLQPLQPLAVKGKAERVSGWVVGAERAAAEPRGVPGLTAPLVGRDEELTALRTAFERVRREGRSELITLFGDAGIGKSRLVREFVSPLDLDAKLLVGRCLPYGEAVTFSPLADMLKGEAVVFDTDPADVATDKIRQLVATTIDADLGGDPARATTALAATLGLQRTDDRLDPRELYRDLVAAWRSLFASLARRAPVVAVVEDLHWADATMLEILDELAERLEGPILFVCTSRPDLLRSRPEWGGGRRAFSSLPLDPLTTEESEQLVSFLLEIDALPHTLRRRMLIRSEGNPFFLEEIVRHLIDEGRVVREDGRWHVTGGIADVDIPDSVQAVILARLDLLSADERRVAQRAAVVGRAFWEGAVAALAPVDDLDGALRTLRRREFVVERLSSSISGQIEYAFKHVLIRDVAYESLPRRERGRAHADAAAWIERTSGERAGEFAELLGRHYDAAFTYLRDDDLRRKARAQLLTAAANALRRFAIEQGERHARRAAELSERGTERLEALEALGDLHYTHGDAAWRAYTEALAGVREDDQAFPRLAAKAAQYGARWIGTMQELPPIEEVRRLIDAGLRTAPARSEERALLLVARGFLLSQREDRRDAETDAALADAAAAAEELGDADVLSAALDLVGADAMHRGRYGEKYRVTHRRLEALPRMTDVKEICDATTMAAWAAQHRGRYREAEAHATTSIERARSIDAGSYLHGLTWRVAARFMLGDWAGALADQAEIERVMALDPRDLPPGYAIRAYTFTALCHELRGDRNRADPYIDVTLRYLAARGQPVARSPLHSPPLALALARRRRFAEAAELLPLVRSTGGTGLTLEALCEIAALREAWADAETLVATARDEAVAGELLSVPLYADRLEGRAAAADGNTAHAVQLLRRSAEGFAALEARWEEAWSRLLVAEATADEDEARAALAVFDELGSVREAERARALLASTQAAEHHPPG